VDKLYEKHNIRELFSLLNNKGICVKNSFSIAAKLKNFKRRCDSKALENSILFSDIDIVKWPKRTKCPLDTWALKCAMDNGSLDILNWLKRNKSPWDNETFLYALHTQYILMV
jgi:hypothetical protein